MRQVLLQQIVKTKQKATDKAVSYPKWNHTNDVMLVRNQGPEMDHSSESAPENIPNDDEIPLTTNLHNIGDVMGSINASSCPDKIDASIKWNWTPMGKA